MRKGIVLLALILLVNGLSAQQEYKRWNVFQINKIATKFSNALELCNGNWQEPALAMPPAFEYPAGSGISYGTDFAFIIAGRRQATAGGRNPGDKPYVEAGMTEGPSDYWDPDHFDPFAIFVGGDRAAISNDPSTWPTNGPNHGWPAYYPMYPNDDGSVDFTDVPVLVKPVINPEDSTDTLGWWPGAAPDGSMLGDLEYFTVVYSIDHLAERPPERWLKTVVIGRGFAWRLPLYEDFIVWEFIFYNPTSAPIESTVVGIWSDYSFVSSFLPPYPWGDDGDRMWYDRNHQFAYAWDIDGMETAPDGSMLEGDQIAWAGTVVLKTPKGDDGNELGVTVYDAFDNWANQNDPSLGNYNGAYKEAFYWYNMLNMDDPDDTDGDGIDDTWYDSLGNAHDYYESNAEPLQLLASGPFTLDPGEWDTLIVATVFGENRADLFKNLAILEQLYRDNWQVIRPPARPRVRAEVGDRFIKLVWGTESEADTANFEGYRIYRSTDGGATWGQPIRDHTGAIVGYVPYAQFDLADGVRGTNPMDPWFFLGDDTGLEAITQVDSTGDTIHVFVDNNVVNGVPYLYAVCAYTKGGPGKPPVENSRYVKDPNIPNDNVVLAVPTLTAVSNPSDIRVVPNPYIVSAGWETSPGEERIDFSGLPDACTIRIYNVSGELVRVLHHTSGPRESWDLLNEEGQQVGPGLYFYVIETDSWTIKGKLAIVH